MKAFQALLWSFLLMAGISAADERVNEKEFMRATQKAGDMRFELSLVQTAAFFDFCGKPEKAMELRKYVQQMNYVGMDVIFMDETGTKDSVQNIRGMYYSRMAGAAIGADFTTTATLNMLKPTASQKKALCDDAEKTYGMYQELRMRAAATGKNVQERNKQ